MAKVHGLNADAAHVEWIPVFEAHLLAKYGIKVRFTQLNGTVAASAGTHKHGAFDLVVTTPGKRTLNEAYKIVVAVARQMGADGTWERPYNWDGRKGIRHIHGLLTGAAGMAQVALNQIAAVKRGRNGLANNGPDTGPKPLSGRTYKQGIAWAKEQAKPSEPPVFVPGMGKFLVTANPSLWGLLEPGSGNAKKAQATKGSTLVTTGYAVVDGVRWYRALDGFYYSGQYLSAVDATPEEPKPVSLSFNVLGFNIYASQYTGGKFSATRTAGLKAVNADARASLNLLSEINLDRDHAKAVEVLGKQFNNAGVYVRATGNNHIYADANKWIKVRSTVVNLINRNQHRRATLAIYRHKATGLDVSVFVTHFSSAAWFRDNKNMSSSAASKQANTDQRAEAAALAKIISGKPIAGWNPKRTVGYIDANRDDVMDWLKPAGFSELGAHGLKNAEYGSLHSLGKAPDKDGERIDIVPVGSDFVVSNARQIVGQQAYNASDHLPQACTVALPVA